MKHVWYKCKQPCTRNGCPYCEGGLGLCTVCGGAEGSLTTDCCGHHLNEHIQDAIYKGGLDFKDGKWYIKEV